MGTKLRISKQITWRKKKTKTEEGSSRSFRNWKISFLFLGGRWVFVFMLFLVSDDY